jgi:hypothetical protein
MIGVGLEGQWSKKGLAAGAVMVCDGVLVQYGVIEIALEGLTPGPHTLVTYHSYVRESPPYPYTISVDSKPVVHGLVPSSLASDDDDAASAFLAFESRPDQPVVVRIESEEPGKTNNVILNGFEIDAQDLDDPADGPADGPTDANHDGYTNLEDYLNWLAAWNKLS